MRVMEKVGIFDYQSRKSQERVRILIHVLGMNPVIAGPGKGKGTQKEERLNFFAHNQGYRNRGAEEAFAHPTLLE